MDNQQSATTVKKSFLVSFESEQTAADLQAELNAWLQERNKYIDTPAPQPEVKQILDEGYLSIEESKAARKMFFEYGNTTYGYKNLLHLFYNFISEDGEVDINNGLWDFTSFLESLVGFFLLPDNAKAFSKTDSGATALPLYLPRFARMMADIAHSNHAQAMLQSVHYELTPYMIKRVDHNELMEDYGLKLSPAIEEITTTQAA